MAIGVTRSAGYAFTGSTGVLNGIQYSSTGQSVKLYAVATSVDLSAEDDAANEAFEAIIQTFPPILAYYSHATSGVISLICDGVNAPAASVLQTALVAIGTKKGSVNLASTTVTDGTSFVIS
jgi:hypothetical protein